MADVIESAGYESPQQEIRVLREAAEHDQQVIAVLRRDVAELLMRAERQAQAIRDLSGAYDRMRAQRDALHPGLRKESDR